MEIYFNDTLLTGDLFEKQYVEDCEGLFHSIKEFSKFCDQIQQKKTEFHKKISLVFYVSHSVLKSFFDFIDNEEVANFFRESLLRANSKNWESSKKQNDQFRYYFFDTTELPPKSYDIKGSTVSEATERKFLYPKNENLVLNLPDLLFSNQLSLLVHRIDEFNQPTPIILNCADNIQLLDEWIEHNLDCDTFRYNYSSANPPTDSQTCLRSKFRFECTSHFYQDRCIYREVKTKKLWYVDNMHFGERAHIEIFDRTGKKHLGIANLDGQIIGEAETSKKQIL